MVVQTYYRARRGRRVDSSAFRPRPRVGSAILELTLREDVPEACTTREGRVAHVGFVRRLFEHRRKVLRAALESYWGGSLDSAPEPVRAAAKRRPQELDPEAAVELLSLLAAGQGS